MLYIGSRIQEYRKKAELSQEEFADKIGVSRQAVSKWERDKAYPDLDRLVCICEILDVQMDEYPEAAFFNVGTIEDVKAKAETLK